jgi:hypothetical protein
VSDLLTVVLDLDGHPTAFDAKHLAGAVTPDETLVVAGRQWLVDSTDKVAIETIARTADQIGSASNDSVHSVSDAGSRKGLIHVVQALRARHENKHPGSRIIILFDDIMASGAPSARDGLSRMRHIRPNLGLFG